MESAGDLHRHGQRQRGAGIANGTVTFTDNGSTLGTEPLSGGQATLSTSSLALGDHPIKASYNGDANNLSSTSTG